MTREVLKRGFFGAVAAFLLPAAVASEARLGADAAVRLDGDDARLHFALFAGGGYCEAVNPAALRVGNDLALNYSLFIKGKDATATGRVTLRTKGNAAVVDHTFTAHAQIAGRAPGFVLRLRASAFKGLGWATDGKAQSLPAAFGKTTVVAGSAKSFALDFPGKRKWTIDFAQPMKFTLLDMRGQNQDEFELRLVGAGQRLYAVAAGGELFCMLTPSPGKVTIAMRDLFGIVPGKTWVKLEKTEGIRPTSALDFSRMAQRHTPAGIDGALVATTNGEFRFSRRPAEPLRLLGCQLGIGELPADKKVSAELSKTLVRMGYNAVRLARLDSRLLTTGVKGLQCDAAFAERLDQFEAVAARDGLVAFVDLPAPRDDAPAAIAMFRSLFDDSMREKWEQTADLVYGRRNGIGRRLYSEDPAVPAALAFADVSLFGKWTDLRAQPFVQDQYGKWLAGKRKAEPDFMKGEVCEAVDLAIMPLTEKKAGAARRFLAECEIEAVARAKAHFSSSRAKALFGAAFGTHGYRDVAALRATAGDFGCEAFHIDPIRCPGANNSLPYRISNVNPLETPSPISATIDWHERPDRALCITSWGAPAPSSWRSLSGLLVGAWAARRKWDALLRDGNPAADPCTAAAERAVFALFARGDMAPDAPADAFVIDKGGLTVKTPRTVGGFSPRADGKIVASPFAATLKGSRAAIWVTSLTDAPVATSKHLLLTHLTEMQTEGTLFSDSRCDLLMLRGKGPYLVRDGSATVELAVEKASSFKVFSLLGDGTRSTRIPVEQKDGVLTFTVAVRGDRTAQYLYEIVRD